MTFGLTDLPRPLTISAHHPHVFTVATVRCPPWSVSTEFNAGLIAPADDIIQKDLASTLPKECFRSWLGSLPVINKTTFNKLAVLVITSNKG